MVNKECRIIVIDGSRVCYDCVQLIMVIYTVSQVASVYIYLLYTGEWCLPLSQHDIPMALYSFYSHW